MTLPASFPLSMSQIASELRLSLPLSTSHAWVQALAGGTPVSFANLLGQTGTLTGTWTPAAGSGHTTVTMNGAFFRGALASLQQTPVAGGNFNLVLTSGAMPNYTGNIKVTGQGGASAVLTYVGGGVWQLLNTSTSLMSAGVQSTFTFQPSN